jgi:hypothetical protein
MKQNYLNWIASLIFTLLLSVSLNVYQYAKPSKVCNTDSLEAVSEHRRGVIHLMKVQYDNLKKDTIIIKRIVKKYEKVTDTINIYTTYQVDSSYIANLRHYEDNRAAYNIARFK